LCPHSEYVSVSDAAHMVAGDRNDIFGNAVIGFLKRVVPVDGRPVHPPRAASSPRWIAGEIQDVP
jgi:hypothetical protein